MLIIYPLPGSVQKPFACIDLFNLHEALWGKGHYPPFHMIISRHKEIKPEVVLSYSQSWDLNLDGLAPGYTELCWPPWGNRPGLQSGLRRRSSPCGRSQSKSIADHWCVCVCAPARTSTHYPYPSLPSHPYFSFMSSLWLWKPSHPSLELSIV